MSSHHFVKEAQEPALVLASENLPAYTTELLEWAPTVIVLQKAFYFVLDQDIKTDVVITQSDHEHWRNAFQHQHPIKFLAADTEIKGIQLALQHLINQKQRAVNIVCDDAHEIMAILEKTSLPIDVTIFNGQCRYTFYKTGVFRKWLAADTILESLNNAALKKISGSVEQNRMHYRILTDGLIHLTAEGPFWLIEKI